MNRMLLQTFLAAAIFIFTPQLRAAESLPLDGEWRFALDRTDVGANEQWFARDLPDALQELGAIVDYIAIYKTVAETEDRAGAGARLLAEGADWVTFTSSSTVEHFHARFDLPKLLRQFPQLKIASIGPETSKAIRALKLEPAFEAKQHTTDGLIAELLRAAKK